MKISNMLKEKRKEYQLTQEQLAEKIFVSNKTISNWETGKTKPDIESLILLAKLFDLSLDNLLLEGSEMVKSIDTDIKKGRNLKKILLVATLPLILIIIVLSWVTYKGDHMTIVPLDDIKNVKMTTNELTDSTQITGDIKLKSFESYDFVDVTVYENQVYLMIYKWPQLFSRQTSFTVDLNEKLDQATLSSKEVEKISFTYFDTKETNGYGMTELTQEFPKKVVWEK